MIYIASPYSDPDIEVRSARYHKAQDYLYHCMLQKLNAYSPIVYFHPLAIRFQLLSTEEPYIRHNVEMLEICDIIHILTLPGWKESLGVKHEIKFAQRWAKPIYLINPNDYHDIHQMAR